MPESPDLIGYLAAMLVIATFYARSMVVLRSIGIASNIAFVMYGLQADLPPVLLLHSVLLPLNFLRLAEVAPWRKWCSRARGGTVEPDQDLRSTRSQLTAGPVPFAQARRMSAPNSTPTGHGAHSAPRQSVDCPYIAHIQVRPHVAQRTGARTALGRGIP
jgi:hypothetical protein